MFHVKLYRGCDIGGTHSGGVNIPGLLAKEKDANTAPQKNISSNSNTPNYYDILQGYVKNAKQGIEEKLNKQTQKLNEFYEYATKSIGYVDPNSLNPTSEPLMPSPQWLINQQNQQNTQAIGGLNQFFDKNKVLEPPQPKYRKPPRGMQDYMKMMDMLKQTPIKSEFEIIIDYLFNPIEKLEFLKSMGYEHVGTDKVRSNKVDEEVSPEVVDTISQAFLREITKKFKNMLLAKGTIKIKF